MADTDLIFQIIAQDEFTERMSAARAAVDAMTDTEKQAAVVAAQHQSIEESLSGAFDLSTEAKRRATDQLAKLDEQYKSGQISLAEYSEGVEKVKGSIDELSQSQEKSESQTANWSSSLSTISDGMATIGSAIDTVKKAWDFSKEGAAINRISQQFNQVAADFGASGEAMVSAMDRAARGTVDDEELMSVATRAMTQGTIQNQDQLVKFTEIARASSVRFGGDAAQALQSIMYATEVGAARQLKATIGVVDFTKSYEELAKQLGKRKQDLTDEEMLQARVNSVLDKGAELVNKVGSSGDDTATKMQRFETRLADVGDQIKSLAADAFTPLLDRSDDWVTALDKGASATDRLAATQRLLNDPLITGRDSLVQMEVELVKAAAAEKQQAVALEEAKKLTSDVDYANRHLGDSEKELANALEAGNRGIENQSAAFDTAVLSTQRHTQALQDEQAAQAQLVSDLGSITDRAIGYAEQEQKLGDLKEKLSDIDNQIIAQGPRQTMQIDNAKMSTEERAIAEKKLAVAIEDANTVKRKSGETDAEYSLRVSQANAAVTKLSDSLGSHTAVLGGATEAQLKDREAILGQIEAMQLQDNKARAMEGVKALGQALAEHKLTTEEYSKRMGELNQVTGLFSNADLIAATNQQILLDKLADPNSGDWLKILMDSHAELNTQYIPAVDKASSAQATHAEKMEKTLDQYGKNKEAVNTYKVSQDVLASTLNNQVAAAHQDHILKMQAEETEFGFGKKSVQDYIDKLLAIPPLVTTTVKTVYTTSGTPPTTPGEQHALGIDMIIPPNYNENYPLGYASSGERFTVTPAGQGYNEMQAGGASVVHAETFNLYDTLITRQVVEQRRIDALKSITGAM